MNVRGLRPNEYWETSKHDYELASDVQAAWRNGIDAAKDEHKASQAASQWAKDRQRERT